GSLYGSALLLSSSSDRKRGSRLTLTIVFGSAAALALIALLHGITDAESVFGLYTPTFRPGRWAMSPLLNPNNLSSVLNLGALVGIGLFLDERSAPRRWHIGYLIATMLGVSLLSGSRAGILLLGLAIIPLIVVVQRWRKKSHRSDRFDHAWGLAIFLLVGVTLASMGAPDRFFE